MSPARRIVRRVRRIVSRIALVLLALVVLAVATVLILVHTSWGRNKIREQIVAGMADTFPCGVRIGAVEGSVVGDTVVRDVVIKDCDGRDAVKIERLELNIKLTSLLDRTLRLEYLHARGVAVDAHKTGGRINLVDMLHTSLNLPGPGFIRYPRGAGLGVKIKDQPVSLTVGHAEVLREAA